MVDTQLGALAASGGALVQSVGRRLNIESCDLREDAGLVFVALADSVAWETWFQRLDHTCPAATD